jgi:hypothetical protein
MVEGQGFKLHTAALTGRRGVNHKMHICFTKERTDLY